MEANDKTNSKLIDYINEGYEILINNVDAETKEQIQAIMELSVSFGEGTEFEFKRNALIGVLEKVKELGK